MSLLFTCSIDDGHPLDMRTAELLDKHGLRATFYVPIKNREGSYVMTRENLRELSRRFEVGSHTYDHCYLRELDVRRTYYQISKGKNGLEDVLGLPINGFCYPGGKYSAKDIDMVRACGFVYARTTANLFLDAGHSRLELPTTIQFYPHSRGVYLRNYARSGDWLKRAGPLYLALRNDHWIKRLHALFDHAVEAGRVFHLWGHSKQIDELDAWDEFEAFLAHVGQQVRADARLTNGELVQRVYGVERKVLAPTAAHFKAG
ncbi:polysaccharide deacetylase family protein [Noviherbaspirillum galbum]|uniref:Polysaccharide deacetylase family protein n=1 Tax=Noviherbaspirillum galbum TaxID=2709383 RepID=A0A6B3STM6_9BURK|nr:polysaccharide deacetylase family protein [Noviherbaspirillum galbum]NEX62715.1 polysaccharide deacetylase family protein [Noviherbaspirillum galbum]